MSRLRDAEQLMLAFAERTGLDSRKSERRYLWTDAFAASRRLAFRELGLAIGLSGLDLLLASASSVAALGREALRALSDYQPLSSSIVEFWLNPHHQRVASWSEHLDINEVMLAASLLPEGSLPVPAPALG